MPGRAGWPGTTPMRDAAYRSRLAADLPHWRERGWVSEEGARAILAALPDRAGPGLTALVTTLGGVLLGLGVMALVAANWEAIPRIARFLGLCGLAVAAYAAADALRRRDRPALAEAALIVAGLVFAGTIAFVGQSYHLAGEFTGAILLFALGMLGAAALARSTGLAVLAVVGSAAWTVTTMVDDGGLGLAGLALILAAGAVGLLLDSRPARGLAIVALGGWIVLALGNGIGTWGWHAGGAAAAGIAAALALWALGHALAALPGRPRLAGLGRDLVHPALAAAIAGLALLQLGGLVGLGDARGGLAAPLVLACGLVGLAALLGTAAVRRGALGPAEVGAMAGLGAATVVFVVAFPGGSGFAVRLLGALLVLAAALFAVWVGQAGRQPGAKRMGLTAFGLEVAYVYVVTLGTVLDTALSLIAGGLLFIGLAALLIRVNRALAARGIGAA